jgi:hypothetical protein
MNKNKKVIAFYLPQFHTFKENNEWWGDGYTEWNNVKNATPLFSGHLQPRIPLEGYYDLSTVKDIQNQALLAKKHNIHGFCFYHYWFEGKLLMNKPAELLLSNLDININFCFSWANHNFHNKVQYKQRILLLEQTYGGKDDWINHFDYLLTFFKDDRYIKVNNKPMLILYDSKNIPNLLEMMSFFNSRALASGFSGIHFVNTLKDYLDVDVSSKFDFAAQVEYQPYFSNYYNILKSKFYDLRRIFYKDFLKKPLLLDTKKVWKNIVRSTPKNKIDTYIGAYTGWDTSPRWGSRSIIHINGNLECFAKNFEYQINRNASNLGEFVFITAWNEWGEGAYLEPDQSNKYAYLETVKSIMDIHKG